MSETTSSTEEPAPAPDAGPGGSPWPMVSVIMPVRNEGSFIERSLGAVLAQEYPADRLEVLVVDGMSDDGTREWIAAFMDRPARVRLLDNPGKIVPTAMNVGIRAAEGEIVVRVDGHTIIAPDYVRRAVEALARTGAHDVGGLMRPAARGYVARTIALATSVPFGVGGGDFHYAEEERETDTVYMGVYPKWVLEHVGMYDEEFVRNQDDELNDRLRKAGGRIVLCPELRSEYYPRTSWTKLASQYYQYGWWKVRVLQKHPRQLRKSHFIPGAFALAFVIGVVGAPFSRFVRRMFGLMMLLWGAGAIVSAFLAGRERDEWDTVPALPVAFLVLHLGYGFGFLAGLIHFADRWGEPATEIPSLPTHSRGWPR